MNLETLLSPLSSFRPLLLSLQNLPEIEWKLFYFVAIEVYLLYYSLLPIKLTHILFLEVTPIQKISALPASTFIFVFLILLICLFGIKKESFLFVLLLGCPIPEDLFKSLIIYGRLQTSMV